MARTWAQTQGHPIHCTAGGLRQFLSVVPILQRKSVGQVEIEMLTQFPTNSALRMFLFLLLSPFINFFPLRSAVYQPDTYSRRLFIERSNKNWEEHNFKVFSTQQLKEELCSKSALWQQLASDMKMYLTMYVAGAPTLLESWCWTQWRRSYFSRIWLSPAVDSWEDTGDWHNNIVLWELKKFS